MDRFEPELTYSKTFAFSTDVDASRFVIALETTRRAWNGEKVTVFVLGAKVEQIEKLATIHKAQAVGDWADKASG